MRKLFALTAVFGMLTIGASSMLMAQENDATQTEDATLEITVDENATMEEAAIADPTVLEDESQIESTSFHAALKQKFIEGGAFWMLPIALCLIFGLAIAIERVIYLNLASTNNKKFNLRFNRRRQGCDSFKRTINTFKFKVGTNLQ